MSNCSKQVQKLEDAIKELPNDVPTRPLWERISYLLGEMCSSMDSVYKAMRGDGNGEKGLLNRVGTLENMVARTQSDVRYALTLILISMGYEHDPEAALKRLNSEFPGQPKIELQRFSQHENPGRRTTDNQPSFDKFVSYIVNRILPPLVVALIVGAVTFWIAVNSHIIVDI